MLFKIVWLIQNVSYKEKIIKIKIDNTVSLLDNKVCTTHHELTISKIYCKAIQLYKYGVI